MHKVHHLIYLIHIILQLIGSAELIFVLVFVFYYVLLYRHIYSNIYIMPSHISFTCEIKAFKTDRGKLYPLHI